MSIAWVIGAWRTEKGKRQRIRAFGGRREVEEELAASALRREEGVMSKMFHPFSKTKKVFLLFPLLRLMINCLSPKRK